MRQGLPKKSTRLNSFTLAELLVVILIIVILAGLTLAAGEGVMTSAARSRTKSEIQALGNALEAYKVDNGVYPWTNGLNTPTYSPVFNAAANTTDDPGTSGGTYQVSGQILYEALAGKTNYEDQPTAGVKTYMNFKAGQLGNISAAANSGWAANTSTYVQDPFGYSYGYYANAAAAAPPTNGAGMYDLWSTAGALSTTVNWQNTWISNWNGQ